MNTYLERKMQISNDSPDKKICTLQDYDIAGVLVAKRIRRKHTHHILTYPQTFIRQNYQQKHSHAHRL